MFPVTYIYSPPILTCCVSICGVLLLCGLVVLLSSHTHSEACLRESSVTYCVNFETDETENYSESYECKYLKVCLQFEACKDMTTHHFPSTLSFRADLSLST